MQKMLEGDIEVALIIMEKLQLKMKYIENVECALVVKAIYCMSMTLLEYVIYISGSV